MPARKEKLLYFPVDIGYNKDTKFLKAMELLDPEGNNPTLRIQCQFVFPVLLGVIFNNGYFIQWNDDMSIWFANVEIGYGFPSVIFKKILNSYLEVGLLNKELYEKSGVLTSKGIQTRWLNITKLLRRVAKIDTKYNLIKNRSNENVDNSKKNNTYEKLASSADRSSSATDRSSSATDRSKNEGVLPLSVVDREHLFNNNNSIVYSNDNKDSTIITIIKENFKSSADRGEKGGLEGLSATDRGEKVGLEGLSATDRGEKGGLEGLSAEKQTKYSYNYLKLGKIVELKSPGNVLFLIDNQFKGALKPINCLYNFIENPIYRHAVEEICGKLAPFLKFDGEDDPVGVLKDWGEVFNQHITLDGVSDMPMVGGSSGWIGYFRRWLAKADKSKNPKTILDFSGNLKAPKRPGRGSTIEEQEEYYKYNPSERKK